MAHVMEFLLNLLLINGKLLTEKAAQTVREAIRKCLNYRSKLHMQYHKVTKINFPYENMMECVNYNACEYAGEGNGENLVVNREFRYKLFEELSRANKQQQQSLDRISDRIQQQKAMNMMATLQTFEQQYNSTKIKNNNNTIANNNNNHDNNRPIVNEYIIENLFAILRSQEILFANINKLVASLEKENFNHNDQAKLENIKRKLSACNEILSGNRNSNIKFPDNIINDIIEEEITRCRFRHGDFLTSKEINLKQRQSEGLEVALEVLHKRKITTRPVIKVQTETQTCYMDKDDGVQTDENKSESQHTQTSNIPVKIEREAVKKVTTPQKLEKEAEIITLQNVIKEAKTATSQIPIKKDTSSVKTVHKEDQNKNLKEDKSAEQSDKKLSSSSSNSPTLTESEIEMMSSLLNKIKKSAAVTPKQEITPNTTQIAASKSNEKIKYGRLRLISDKTKNEKPLLQQIHLECQERSKSYIKKQDSESKNKDLKLAETAVVKKDESSLSESGKKMLIKGGDFGQPAILIKRRTVKQKSTDDNIEKVIEVNEQHFHQVENSIWHSRTTTKYLSLKSDYMNMVKCDFVNRRQFRALEMKLAKKAIEDKSNEKTLKISDGKMMEMKQIQGIKKIINNKKEAASKQQEPKIQSILSKKEANILGERLQKSLPETKTILPATSIIIIPNKDGKILIQQLKAAEKKIVDINKKEEIKATTTQSKIPVKKIPSDTDKKKEAEIPKRLSTSTTKISNLDKPKISEKVSQSKIPTIKLDKTLSEDKAPIHQISEENLGFKLKKTVAEKTEQKLDDIKKFAVKVSHEDKTPKNLWLQEPEVFIKHQDNETKKPDESKANENKTIKGNFSSNIEKFIKIKQENQSSNQPIKKEEKAKTQEMALVKATHQPKKLISHIQLRNEAEIIRLNKKAFDELENSLQTVRFFVDKAPKPSKIKITSTEKNKRRIDEPVKKNMSTKQIIPVKLNTSERGDVPIKTSKLIDDCDKIIGTVHSKTFIKKKRKLVGEVLKEVKQAAKMLKIDNEEAENLHRDKSRTFLKSASEITYKKHKDKQSSIKVIAEKKSVSVPKFSIVKKEDEAESIQSDIINKNQSPMRRTTKTAMKKQQVMTILPKIEKKSEETKKSKPKISVLETEEIKIIKAMQNTDGSKNRVVINVTKKHVNYNPIRSTTSRPKNTYLGNHSWKKAPYDKKINLVKWEEEDVKKFVNIFDE